MPTHCEVPRPNAPSASIDRILVVKLSSLGDLFHALPVVRNLKSVTGAAIDWVTQPEYAGLVRCFTDVDRVILFPRRAGIRGIPNFLREVRAYRYDLAVDVQGLLKSALALRAARARQRIGPSYHREGARLFYTAVTGPRSKDRHAVEQAYDLIRYLDWPETDPVFPVRLPDVPPGGDARPRIALAPRSRWETKNWPDDAFIELGRRLIEESGARLYLTGGPAEAALGKRLEQAWDCPERVVNRCGALDLVGLGSLLQEMNLAITVDTGPMHMAAALGVPVLALFGPTDPVRTGPFGPGHRVLRVERLTCSPCFSGECARGDYACMRNLFPSVVADAATEMLQRPDL